MYNISHETIINICTELDWLNFFKTKQECNICCEIAFLYSFSCKHSLCYSCYTKLVNRDVCYYCRQTIFKESDVDNIEYYTILYYITIVIDFLIILFINIFKPISTTFRILFYIQYAYVSLYILFKKNIYINQSNILYTAFNIAFVIVVFIFKKEMYPFYFCKMCFLLTSFTYEYYRYKIRKCFTSSS
jgi:hypothetical protein